MKLKIIGLFLGTKGYADFENMTSSKTLFIG